MADYDKYYQTEDLFGKPCPELIDFFKRYEPIGIDQLNKLAKKERLNVTGWVGDLYSFDKYQDFDIVLLDSMFHFEKGDIKRETNLIDKIVKRINKNGLICICIQDTGKKVSILKESINNTEIEYEVLNDTTMIYHFEDKESGHKLETKYCMYIIKKK